MDKYFAWNSEKNNKIKSERGFGFEDIVDAIENDGLLDDFPNFSERYPTQRVYVVDLNGYAIVVPYVEEDEYFFLKTAFPSRQATKKYLR